MVLQECFGKLFQKKVGHKIKILDAIYENWEEPFGDMRQELVFIGQGLDKEQVTKALDECLLSDSDLLQGRAHWATFDDPFPDEWKETA